MLGQFGRSALRMGKPDEFGQPILDGVASSWPPGQASCAWGRVRKDFVKV